MKLGEFMSSKYASALFAIPSSILTSIVYDALTDSSYSQTTTDNNTIIIEEVSQFSTFQQLAITGGCFVAIWLTFAVISPLIVFLVKRLTYYKKPTLTIKETVKAYYRIKTEIAPYLSPTLDPSDRLIYSDEIFECVNQLHKVFCSTNKLQQTVVVASFRNYKTPTTANIGVQISPYCYHALIHNIEQAYDNLCQKYSNSIWESDKIDIAKKIDDLKNVLPLCKNQ